MHQPERDNKLFCRQLILCDLCLDDENVPSNSGIIRGSDVTLQNDHVCSQYLLTSWRSAEWMECSLSGDILRIHRYLIRQQQYRKPPSLQYYGQTIQVNF